MHLKNLLTYFLFFFGVILLNITASAQKFEPRFKNTRSAVFGQLDQPMARYKARKDQLPNRLRHNPILESQAQEDATGSRLIAVAVSHYDGVMYIPSDSTRLFYSGSNSFPELVTLILKQNFYYDLAAPQIESLDPYMDLRADSAHTSYWNESTENFETAYKNIFAFDNNGQVISETEYYFNGTNWEKDSKTLYSYTSSGKRSTVIYQYWTGSVWENVTKDEFTYDAQGNITENTYSYWDNPTSSWQGSGKYIAMYEGTKMITLIEQYSSGGTWYNNTRSSMIYSGENLVEKMIDFWNDGNWKNAYKVYNTYNAAGNLTTERWQVWDSFEYVNNYRINYTFDQSGKQLSLIFQEWNSGSWSYNYKDDFEYEGSALKSITYSEWESGAMQEYGKVILENNSYGQPTSAKFISYYEDNWAPLDDDVSLRFYYEEFSGGTGLSSVLAAEKIEVYPNPANDFVNVKLKDQSINQIQIIDMTGKVVFATKSQFHAAEVQVPTTQLQNGVYILQVVGGNQVGSSKFVVKH